MKPSMLAIPVRLLIHLIFTAKIPLTHRIWDIRSESIKYYPQKLERTRQKLSYIPLTRSTAHQLLLALA